MIQYTEVEKELAPGVKVSGLYHYREGGYVDIDSIELRGRPDRIAAYLAENNQQHEDFEADPNYAHDRLEGYARILTETLEPS